MDISKEYIAQCDCPEIQDVKLQGRHEFYKDVPKGRCFVPVWLPRQDQLQEMMKYDSGTLEIFNKIQQFYKWFVELNLEQEKWSMEQLWLGFIMYEKYGKTWNGEGWVS